jgi:hypothetical protein
MYEVCAQPGDWTTNAQAQAKTASPGSIALRSVRIRINAKRRTASRLLSSG